MGNARPFRFGVIAERMTTRAAWVDLARKVERLGYATLLIRDHVVPEPFGDQFAPLIALMAAADATTTLRVGTLVLDNDYRHPVLLAKEAATLDLLSSGRFELGLGAGWLAAEYEGAGIPFDRPGVRIGRMEEAIRVVKGLFADGSMTWAGEHYRIGGLDGFPKPAQRPRPPLLVGGGGKRILGIAGREADIASVLTSSVATGTLIDDPLARTSAKIAEKIGWIRAGAGARFDQIELNLIPSIILSDHRRAATERLIATRGWSNITVDQLWDMPSTLIGTTGEIADQIRFWRDTLGFSYIVVADEQATAFAPVVAALVSR